MTASLGRSGRRIDADLSVVIPTLGRDILRASLEALERGTIWPARVIVVDQGRRPEVAALLDEFGRRSFETLWVPSRQTGRAAGVNLGIARATTRFIAVTDDDCLVQDDWVERAGAQLRQTPNAMITGRVEAGGNEVLFVSTDREQIVQRRPSLWFDRLNGGNMAAAKAVIDRLGGLDEDQCLRTAEDGELAYRALRSGVSLVYAPDVVVTHLSWRDEGQRKDQYDGYARSQGGFYGKYLRRGDLFMAARAALHLLRAVRRWVVGVMRNKPEKARIGRAYSVGLIPGIVAGWRSGAAK